MPQVWELFKEITQPTRKRSVLSVPQIAERLGVSPVSVYKWGEPDGKHLLPARVVGPVTRMLEDPLLIEALARESGGFYVPCCVDGMRFSDVARLIREFGEFVTELSCALQDGDVSRTEWERIEREGSEAVSAAMAVVAEARRRMG